MNVTKQEAFMFFFTHIQIGVDVCTF